MLAVETVALTDECCALKAQHSLKHYILNIAAGVVKLGWFHLYEVDVDVYRVNSEGLKQCVG